MNVLNVEDIPEGLKRLEIVGLVTSKVLDLVDEGGVLVVELLVVGVAEHGGETFNKEGASVSGVVSNVVLKGVGVKGDWIVVVGEGGLTVNVKCGASLRK